MPFISLALSFREGPPHFHFLLPCQLSFITAMSDAVISSSLRFRSIGFFPGQVALYYFFSYFLFAVRFHYTFFLWGGGVFCFLPLSRFSSSRCCRSGWYFISCFFSMREKSHGFPLPSSHIALALQTGLQASLLSIQARCYSEFSSLKAGLILIFSKPLFIIVQMLSAYISCSFFLFFIYFFLHFEVFQKRVFFQFLFPIDALLLLLFHCFQIFSIMLRQIDIFIVMIAFLLRFRSAIFHFQCSSL